MILAPGTLVEMATFWVAPFTKAQPEQVNATQNKAAVGA